MKPMKLHTALVLGLVASASFGAMPALAQDIPGMTSQPEASAVPTRPLGLTQNAWNSYLRNRGESKARPGYIRYVYDAQSSYPIRTREGMITTIKMPEGEKLTQAFAGDETGFQVALATETSIVIKAAYPGVDTNVVAYGEDGRIYTFYVRSEGYQSKEISDFLVEIVRSGERSGAELDGSGVGGSINGGDYGMGSPSQIANAPYTNPSAVARTVRDPYATQQASLNPKYREYAEWTDFNPRTIVEDLGVYVERTIPGGTIPYRVFRDDRFTYIDYGPNASQMTEWPSPQIVIQGVEGPVGNRTAGPGGRMIVLEARGDFILRNGQRAIIIKPKASYTAPNLVEYPVTSAGRMRVPTDLPPGQLYPAQGTPQTVKPIDGAPATIYGEAPSQIVELPDPKVEPIRKKGKKGLFGRKTVTETVSKTVVPVAKGGGSPIETVVATRQVTTATNGTGYAGYGAYPAPSRAVPAVTAPVYASNGAYYVSLGSGNRTQLEDKWKSYKVQYYNELAGKSAQYVNGPAGTELRIMPVRDASEGIKLCGVLSSETDCSVKTVR